MADRLTGKKSKDKKKSGKSKVPIILDGISTEEMNKEQLEEHIKRLHEELGREREERNYFQLERDKINTFWEISKSQLEQKKSELRNKDREMEDNEERHQIEIKVYKQKVKHLLYEQQNNMSEVKAENTVALKLAEDDHRSNELAMRHDKRELKVSLKDQQLQYERTFKNLELQHDCKVTDLREDYDRRIRELETRYDKKMRALRDELDLQRKTELHETEERKNMQINELKKQHEKAFSDIKNYYNDITINNLALINVLKEEIEEVKKREDRLQKQMSDLTSENRKLVEPMSKAKEEVNDLQRQLNNYSKDKLILTSTKGRLKRAEENIKSLEWEKEVLHQKFEQIQSERDELYDKFVKAISEVQQKTNFKNLLLERKLTSLSDALEKKEVQLTEILASANLDPTALNIISKKLEGVLDTKNNSIKDLQYELAKVCKAHNDVIRAYESRLVEFGIPVEEMGFKPLDPILPNQVIGRAPAGLVSTQS